jgi:hypothetical protein
MAGMVSFDSSMVKPPCGWLIIFDWSGEMCEDFDILKKKDLMASGFYNTLGEIVSSMVRSKRKFHFDNPNHLVAVEKTIALVADSLLKVKPLSKDERYLIMEYFKEKHAEYLKQKEQKDQECENEESHEPPKT